MADNVAITAGTGTSIATDEVTTLNGGTVAAVQVQRMKPVYGVDGSATDVSSTNGLPIQGITAASSSTSWTSATSVNTANTISVGGMNAVSVTLVPTTTFTGGVLTFEVSPDNTNWVPISMARIDTFTNESTYTIVASTNRGWTTSVDGFTNFRVRLSTAITGTGTATVIIIPQAFAIEPMVTVGQSTASQLNAAVSGNIASGATDSGNPVKVGGAYNSTLPTLTTGQRGDLQVDSSARLIVNPVDNYVAGALNALNATLTLNLNNAGSVTFGFFGTLTGTVRFDYSIDGTNWQTNSLNVWSTIGTTGLAGTSLSNIFGTYTGNVQGFAAVRAVVTAYTSGGATCTIRSSPGPAAPLPYSVLVGASTVPSIAPGQIALAYDGTSYQRVTTATSANGTTAIGALGAGILGFDGTNYRRLLTNTTGQLVTPAATTTGGATTFTLISAATTNATSVKASAGTVYGIQASNTGAAAAFLKIFNLATAPTVGTSVAAMTLIIPAGGGITVPIPPTGLAFGTGISISITAVATTADTTAVALAQVVANIQYA